MADKQLTPALDEQNIPGYFHGAIERVEAESRLKAAGATNGMFLVREKFPDTVYVVSVCADGQVFHLMFERQENAEGGFGQNFVSDGKVYEGCDTVDKFITAMMSNPTADTMLVKTPLPRPTSGTSA